MERRKQQSFVHHIHDKPVLGFPAGLVVCLRISSLHNTVANPTPDKNRLYLWIPSKLISPFRLEDFGLQDWHWALDDIDDDCSSIHFWWPHMVTVCVVCAVQCSDFRGSGTRIPRGINVHVQSEFAVILKRDGNTADQIWILMMLLLLCYLEKRVEICNVVFRVVADQSN